METDMYGYDVDLTDTKQQRAFNKLMDRSGPRPATDAKLHTERFDNLDDAASCSHNHRDFITNIINYGNGTYIVEYMA
jgi:hypothetical protein